MQTNRRNLLGGMGALLGAGAGLLPRSAQAQRAATLRFVPYTDLAVLDPGYSTSFTTRTHALLVFDTLYGLTRAFARSRRWSRAPRWTRTACAGTSCCAMA